MGTQKTNKEKYLELWELFEKEIETSTKLTSNTLSGFAKYYEKHSESAENTDYQKVYDRLKKMKQRKNTLKNIRENTLHELQEYYDLLRAKYITQELASDEGFKYIKFN